MFSLNYSKVAVYALYSLIIEYIITLIVLISLVSCHIAGNFDLVNINNFIWGIELLVLIGAMTVIILILSIIKSKGI